jgi:BolA-like protein 1
LLAVQIELEVLVTLVCLQGLAALLVKGLSGCSPMEIVNVEPDFIEALGLKQTLTPSRNNGFLNMFRLMQKRALDAIATTSNVGIQ